MTDTSRFMRAGLCLAAITPLLGCVMAYMPGTSPPGRFKPITTPGEFEVGIDVDLNRNLADGVSLRPDGDLCSESSSAPVWLGGDMVFRGGIIDGLGAELRLGASLLLPLPVPLPNSVGLAPVISLGEPSQGLHLSTTPRFMRIAGALVSSGGSGSSSETKVNATGLDLPLLLGWDAAPWFTATGGLYLRGYRMSAVQQETVEGSASDEVRATWLAYGAGATMNAVFTLGVVRLGLGGGLELVPSPLADYGDACDGDPHVMALVPQAGISLGVTWGGEGT